MNDNTDTSEENMQDQETEEHPTDGNGEPSGGNRQRGGKQAKQQQGVSTPEKVIMGEYRYHRLVIYIRRMADDNSSTGKRTTSDGPRDGSPREWKCCSHGSAPKSNGCRSHHGNRSVKLHVPSGAGSVLVRTLIIDSRWDNSLSARNNRPLSFTGELGASIAGRKR